MANQPPQFENYQWGPVQPTPPEQPPKKKRRVFLWVFLAIQVLFLIMVITGGSSNSDPDCTGYTAEQCKSLDDAGDAGTAIGVGLLIALWAAVDVILGVTYGIYRLAKRK